MFYSEYLDDIFSPVDYRKTFEWAKKAMSCFECDAIAFRGTSGSSIAFPLSLSLQIPLLHVRKHSSHCASRIEGYIDCHRYVIIDDLVCSGDTLRIIKDTIINPEGLYREREIIPQCIGVILYDEMSQGREDLIREKINGIFSDTKLVTRNTKIPSNAKIPSNDVRLPVDTGSEYQQRWSF